MQAIKFKNFSNEEFVWKFDGVPFTFKAGQEMYMEEFKARFFAKHLVDRELNRLNISTMDMKKRSELEKLALPADEQSIALEVAFDIETKKKRAGRPKKVEEEEFSDLNKHE